MTHRDADGSDAAAVRASRTSSNNDDNDSNGGDDDDDYDAMAARWAAHDATRPSSLHLSLMRRDGGRTRWLQGHHHHHGRREQRSDDTHNRCCSSSYNDCHRGSSDSGGCVRDAPSTANANATTTVAMTTTRGQHSDQVLSRSFGSFTLYSLASDVDNNNNHHNHAGSSSGDGGDGRHGTPVLSRHRTGSCTLHNLTLTSAQARTRRARRGGACDDSATTSLASHSNDQASSDLCSECSSTDHSRHDDSSNNNNNNTNTNSGSDSTVTRAPSSSNNGTKSTTRHADAHRGMMPSREHDRHAQPALLQPREKRNSDSSSSSSSDDDDDAAAVPATSGTRTRRDDDTTRDAFRPPRASFRTWRFPVLTAALHSPLTSPRCGSAEATTATTPVTRTRARDGNAPCDSDDTASSSDNGPLPLARRRASSIRRQQQQQQQQQRRRSSSDTAVTASAAACDDGGRVDERGACATTQQTTATTADDAAHTVRSDNNDNNDNDKSDDDDEVDDDEYVRMLSIVYRAYMRRSRTHTTTRERGDGIDAQTVCCATSRPSMTPAVTSVQQQQQQQHNRHEPHSLSLSMSSRLSYSSGYYSYGCRVRGQRQQQLQQQQQRNRQLVPQAPPYLQRTSSDDKVDADGDGGSSSAPRHAHTRRGSTTTTTSTTPTITAAAAAAARRTTARIDVGASVATATTATRAAAVVASPSCVQSMSTLSSTPPHTSTRTAATMQRTQRRRRRRASVLSSLATDADVRTRVLCRPLLQTTVFVRHYYRQHASPQAAAHARRIDEAAHDEDDVKDKNNGAAVVTDATTATDVDAHAARDEPHSLLSLPPLRHYLTPATRLVRHVHTLDGVERCVDDDEGNLVVYVGMRLLGWLEVVSLLGAGSFGQVFLCKDLRICDGVFVHPSDIDGSDFAYWNCSHAYLPWSDCDMPPTHAPLVAVKVVKSVPLLEQQSLLEAEMLVRIGAQVEDGNDDDNNNNNNNNDNNNNNNNNNNSDSPPCADARTAHVAKILADGVCYGHHCIVMERYGANLYEYVQSNDHRGLPMYRLRSIGAQLLRALTLLHDKCHIVHADIKPENLLLALDSRCTSWPADGTSTNSNKSHNSSNVTCAHKTAAAAAAAVTVAAATTMTTALADTTPLSSPSSSSRVARAGVVVLHGGAAVAANASASASCSASCVMPEAAVVVPRDGRVAAGRSMCSSSSKSNSGSSRSVSLGRAPPGTHTRTRATSVSLYGGSHVHGTTAAATAVAMPAPLRVHTLTRSHANVVAATAAQAQAQGARRRSNNNHNNDDNDDSDAATTTSADALHIKVIDFSSSCYVHQTCYSYIQSRYYRAPEVIVGSRYGTGIDVWSAGCVLAELLLGMPLLPGCNDHHQLQLIEELISPLPTSTLRGGELTAMYYDVVPRHGGARAVPQQQQQQQQQLQHNGNNDDGDEVATYVLVDAATYAARRGVAVQEYKRYFTFRSLQEFVRFCPLSMEERRMCNGLAPDDDDAAAASSNTTNNATDAATAHDADMDACVAQTRKEMMRERYLLYDLLQQMLCTDAARRPSAAQALQHPFFTTTWHYTRLYKL